MAQALYARLVTLALATHQVQCRYKCSLTHLLTKIQLLRIHFRRLALALFFGCKEKKWPLAEIGSH